MKIRNAVAGLAVGAGLLAGAGMAQARSVELEINTAPPPERYEAVPAERPGYVYEHGHYKWDGHAYVWSDGRYVEARKGHSYVQPSIEHRGEHYYYRSGHWDDD